MLYKDESGDSTYLLDTTDWSRTSVEIELNDNDGLSAYCFSTDEEIFYSYNRSNDSVIAYDLSNNTSEEYPLGAAVLSEVLDDGNSPVGLQVSKDGKTVFVTSYVYQREESSEEFSVVFSEVDFKNSNITTKYEYSLPSDYLYRVAWISADGKNGYVIRDYEGEDHDSHSSYDAVTIDLSSKKIINTSEFNTFYNERVIVNDDGAAIGPSYYVSNGGDVTSTYYTNLEHNSLNQDGSLVLGLYNGDCDGLGSDSSDLASLEMIVVDNKTGKTKWKTKYPADMDLISGNDYGSMTNDGGYVLANGRDGNDNNLLYLIDTKTGAHSQINLRGSLEHDSVGDDYLGSAWFSRDNTLIYVVQKGKDDGFRIDVYKSGISIKTVLSGSIQGIVSALQSPYAIILILLAVSTGGFFAFRIYRGCKEHSAAVNDTTSTVSQRAFSKEDIDQQFCQAPVPSDAPRFCGSCGSPLVPEARFCPHCGSPVKR